MIHQDWHGAIYESVTDFLDAAKLPPAVVNEKSARQNAQEQCEAMTGNRNGARWYGANCESGAAVVALMDQGWKQGLDRCTAALAKLDVSALSPIDLRRRLVRTDFGDDYDANIARTGNFDRAWTRAKRRHGMSRQSVTVVANMTINANMETNILFWRGAAIVALCELLEPMGYNVAAIVGFAADYDHSSAKHAECRVTVKRQDMPLDLSSASAILLPGFFRGPGIAWLYNHSTHAVSTGIGSASELTVDPACEYLISHNVSDEKTAMRAVKDIVAAINGDADDIREAI